jgi:general secretion pathway protein A
MYTAFYGLREKPFALSPDPRFLYLAGSHREALAHLLYGIEQGEGFISVTGEVGTGKTTLCRTLLERLEGEIEVAFLFNPSRTALELLQSICAEFGLPAEGLARRSLMTQLNGFLVEKKREGRRVLLIIDEAQTLTENTLEQVRLLSNLETSREKLLQILLLGQPELDRKLDERGLRQLRQRISVRWKLSPLAPTETRAYVRHRLSVAAGEPKGLFTESALREVYRRTGGVPRLVNQLCDRALLGGYAARAESIGPGLVRAAAKEIPDARRPRERDGSEKSGRPWLFFVSMCALVGIGLIAGLYVGRNGLIDATQFALFDDRGGAEVSNARGEADATPTAPTQPAVAAPPPTLARLIGPVSDPLPPLDGTPLGPLAAMKVDVERVTALGPGLLVHTLEGLDPNTAIGTTERALLARFGRNISSLAPIAETPTALEASLVAQGLEVTAFDGGSLSLLRRLDHPVALALEAGGADSPESAAGAGRESALTSGSLVWVAVLGFEGDRVRVVGLLGEREVSVPIEEFEQHWSETGILVWERYEQIPEVLSSDDEGGGVVWLQRSLAELNYQSDTPTGLFDAATVEALKRFQRDRGLIADGVAGPLTQIALFGQLERYPVPRLSADPNTTQASDSPPAPHSPSPRQIGGGERG